MKDGFINMLTSFRAGIRSPNYQQEDLLLGPRIWPGAGNFSMASSKSSLVTPSGVQTTVTPVGKNPSIRQMTIGQTQVQGLLQRLFYIDTTQNSIIGGYRNHENRRKTDILTFAKRILEQTNREIQLIRELRDQHMRPGTGTLITIKMKSFLGFSTASNQLRCPTSAQLLKVELQPLRCFPVSAYFSCCCPKLPLRVFLQN